MDLLTNNGLLANIQPVAVKKVIDGKEKLYVYDGNRRISCCKILKNPSLLDDLSQKKKIETLLENKNLDFLNIIRIYVTEDEEEAFNIMDKTHGGEQKGVGTIEWKPYERDVSYNKRGKPAFYATAFNICSILDYKREKDLPIPYTDLDRIFKSETFKNIFDIQKFDSKSKNKIANAIENLLKYKEVKGFASFNREFNITKGENETEGKIVDFQNWYNSTIENKNKFKITVKPLTIFIDQTFDQKLLDIEIKDLNGKNISYNDNELTFNYYDPSSKRKSKIGKISGDWQVKIYYKGIETKTIVKVKNIVTPSIHFVDEVKKDLKGRLIFRLEKGKTQDLIKLISICLNKYEKSVDKINVVVSSSNAKIQNKVFLAENEIGEYTIEYKFEDFGIPCSEVIYLQVYDGRDFKISTTPQMIINFPKGININFQNDIINELIREINILSEEKFNYKCLIASSLRSLLELALTELNGSKLINLKDELEEKTTICELQKKGVTADDLLVKCEILHKWLKNNYQKGIYERRNKGSSFFGDSGAKLIDFNQYKNIIESQIDMPKLVKTLHLGAHSSIRDIDFTDLLNEKIKIFNHILFFIDTIARTK